MDLENHHFLSSENNYERVSPLTKIIFCFQKIIQVRSPWRFFALNMMIFYHVNMTNMIFHGGLSEAIGIEEKFPNALQTSA